jgi:hypothetical protein
MNPSNDPQDDELRGLLRELGHAGERRAQPFSDTWRATKTRQPDSGSRWRPGWIAAAAAATVAIFAVAVWPPKPAPGPRAPGEMEIASDESLPTDFLLVTHNDDSVERLTGEIDALLRP